MRKNTKIIGFSVPVSVAEDVDAIAQRERRTKSEVFQAMLRLYKTESAKRGDDFDEWVNGIIVESLEEKQQSPMTAEQAITAFRSQAKTGQNKGAAQGRVRTEEDINRIVHEERKARKAPQRS